MRSQNIVRGKVEGVLYTFAKGEGLPLHDHTPETAHVTFVMRGSVQISGPAISPKVLVAGNVYDFPHTSPHAILALEDNAVIWNAIKGPV